MNEKLKKKDNILTCLIEEKDIKAIESPKMTRLETEVKDKKSSKNNISNKTNKNQSNFSPNNTFFLSNNNRSFSIDLNRKHNNNNTQENFIENNNGIKTKVTKNHSVIKLYNLSPIKSNSIDINKDKKTRNSSNNQFVVKSNSKKHSRKLKADPVSNNEQISRIMKKLSNNNLAVAKENIITNDRKKNKSQTSTVNTPASLNIINSGDVICIGTAKSKISSNSKKSMNKNNNNKGSNNKTLELEREIINETFRTSLTHFKSILSELVKKNKHNISFLKEIDYSYKKILSQTLNKENFFDLIEDGDLREDKAKNDHLEKKINSILGNKDENQQFRQMKTFLENLRNDIKMDDTKNNKVKEKVPVKSRSLLTNSTNNNNSQHISLLKLDDKYYGQKASQLDKKSGNKTITTIKNKSQRNPTILEIVINKHESKAKRENNSKRNNIHQRITNTNVVETNLENSIISLNSEASIDNQKEIIYTQNNNKSKKHKQSSLPKLDFNKNKNDNCKNEKEYMTTNTPEMKESRSENTSLYTPDRNFNSIRKISDETKEKNTKKLNFNQISFDKESLNNGKSNSNISNNNITVNLATDKDQKSKSFLLNLQNLPKIDYNTEFMSKFEEFSPSWRNECKKLKGLNIVGSDSNILKLQKD